MTTEEKAKAYDESLEKARKRIATEPQDHTDAILKDIFPQLKESEDERTRKELIELISCMHDADPRKKRWIAYLEKQKECGEANFREGYLHGFEDAQKEQKPSNNIDQLKSMMLQYLQEAANEKDDSAIEADTDKWARKILGYDFEQKPVDDKAFEEWIDVWYNEHHRDGYITMDEREFKNFCRGIRNMYQQKPAEWSEEDKAMIDDIIFSLPRMANGSIEILPSVAKSYSERLKSLKDRGNFPKSNTNSPSEWSKEDENVYKWVYNLFERSNDKWFDCVFAGCYPKVRRESVLSWLKSLRPQPKQELSIEKAIQWLDDTFYFLDNSSGRGQDCEITTHDFDSLEEMYSSFRKAVAVDSQPHWKPSEEQMEALSETIAFAPDTFKPKCTLVTLQDDLKKLMEE